MSVFWKCITAENLRYPQNIQYLSDPSIDLIDKFKNDIIYFEDPKKHSAYVPCTHVEKSQGNILFVLFSRVELILKPDEETHELYFVSCEDNQ